jgi:hypothetical protein
MYGERFTRADTNVYESGPTTRGRRTMNVDDGGGDGPEGARAVVHVGIEVVSRRPLTSVVGSVALLVVCPALVAALVGVSPESLPIIGGVIAAALWLLEVAVGAVLVFGYVLVFVGSIVLLYGIRTGKADDWFGFGGPTDSSNGGSSGGSSSGGGGDTGRSASVAAWKRLRDVAGDCAGRLAESARSDRSADSGDDPDGDDGRTERPRR